MGTLWSQVRFNRCSLVFFWRYAIILFTYFKFKQRILWLLLKSLKVKVKLNFTDIF